MSRGLEAYFSRRLAILSIALDHMFFTHHPKKTWPARYVAFFFLGNDNVVFYRLRTVENSVLANGLAKIRRLQKGPLKEGELVSN
jgi:hypothetical protein